MGRRRRARGPPRRLPPFFSRNAAKELLRGELLAKHGQLEKKGPPLVPAPAAALLPREPRSEPSSSSVLHTSDSAWLKRYKDNTALFKSNSVFLQTALVELLQRANARKATLPNAFYGAMACEMLQQFIGRGRGNPHTEALCQLVYKSVYSNWRIGDDASHPGCFASKTSYFELANQQKRELDQIKTMWRKLEYVSKNKDAMQKRTEKVLEVAISNWQMQVKQHVVNHWRAEVALILSAKTRRKFVRNSVHNFCGRWFTAHTTGRVLQAWRQATILSMHERVVERRNKLLDEEREKAFEVSQKLIEATSLIESAEDRAGGEVAKLKKKLKFHKTKSQEKTDEIAELKHQLATLSKKEHKQEELLAAMEEDFLALKKEHGAMQKRLLLAEEALKNAPEGGTVVVQAAVKEEVKEVDKTADYKEIEALPIRCLTAWVDHYINLAKQVKSVLPWDPDCACSDLGPALRDGEVLLTLLHMIAPKICGAEAAELSLVTSRLEAVVNYAAALDPPVVGIVSIASIMSAQTEYNAKFLTILYRDHCRDPMAKDVVSAVLEDIERERLAVLAQTDALAASELNEGLQEFAQLYDENIQDLFVSKDQGLDQYRDKMAKEINDVRQYFLSKAYHLKAIFQFYSTSGSSPGGISGMLGGMMDMSEEEFQKLVRDCAIKDAKLTGGEVHLIYARCVKKQHGDSDDEDGDGGGEAGHGGGEHGRDLEPSGFAEALVRMAVEKYGHGRLVKRVSKFCDKDIFTKALRTEAAAFRMLVHNDRRLHAAVEEYKVTLLRVFLHYSGTTGKGGRRRRRKAGDTTMDTDEFVNMLKDCQLLDAGISSQSVQLIFTNVQVDDGDDSDGVHPSALDVDFFEFIEALIAVTCFKFPNPYIPLSLNFTTFLNSIFLIRAKQATKKAAEDNMQLTDAVLWDNDADNAEREHAAALALNKKFSAASAGAEMLMHDMGKAALGK